MQKLVNKPSKNCLSTRENFSFFDGVKIFKNHAKNFQLWSSKEKFRKI